MRGAEQLEQRVGRGDRLEAAAVAAAADGALRRRTKTWPSSPAKPVAPRCSRPPRTMPGADARRDHHVDHVREAAAGAERDLGERAEVGVVVDRDGQVEPPRELARRRSARSSRAGSPSSRRSRRASIGPESAIADADHVARARCPASASTTSTSSAAASSAAAAAVVDVELERAARRARSTRGRRRRRGGGRWSK